MLIYVLTPEDLNISVGVRKKANGQINSFQKFFGTCGIFYLENGKIYFELKSVKGTEKILVENANGIKKILYYRNIYRYLTKDKFSSKFDESKKIAYFRFPFFDIFTLRLIRFLKNNDFLIVFEVPTPNFLIEWKKYGIVGKYLTILFRIFGKKAIKRADLIVSVSEKTIIPKWFEKICDDKTVIVGNGVNIEEIKSKKRLEKNPDEEFHIISVANNSIWHGYDRIIKGLSDYYSKNHSPKVIYHIVGIGSENEFLESLTRKFGLEKYVLFHGKKTGEELLNLYSISHIAISSLGVHRNGIFMLSALKNREYCAVGIPFVYSAYDPDFPDGFKFAMRIPQTDEPINIEEIIYFYKKISKYDYIKEMRIYAEQNLTWEVKMEPVIAKIFEKLEKKQPF